VTECGWVGAIASAVSAGAALVGAVVGVTAFIDWRRARTVCPGCQEYRLEKWTQVPGVTVPGPLYARFCANCRRKGLARAGLPT
jgi:hypothetical protein